MASDDKPGHPRGPVHLGTLTYPAHAFSPEYLLNFTELKGFQEDWDALGLNIEDDLGGLQVEIMVNPFGGDLIPNTGGLRRLRFRPLSWESRNESVFINYVHFQEFGHVLLIMAYAFSDDEPLSRADRKEIKRLIDEERQILTTTHFPRLG